jgi:hypothetical protein
MIEMRSELDMVDGIKFENLINNDFAEFGEKFSHMSRYIVSVLALLAVALTPAPFRLMKSRKEFVCMFYESMLLQQGLC